MIAKAFFIVFSAGFFATVRKAPLLTVTDIEYLKYRGRSKGGLNFHEEIVYFSRLAKGTVRP